MTLIAALIVLGAPPQIRNENRQFQLKDLQRVTLKTNNRSILAWVMDTTPKRSEGMMFLTDKEVKPDDGMIFVFDRPQPLGFWMRNTILPLDLIFIDGRGRVLNVAQGKPFDESPIPSSGSAQFVLELRQGGAKRFGIVSGTRIEIPSTVRSKD